MLRLGKPLKGYDDAGEKFDLLTFNDSVVQGVREALVHEHILGRPFTNRRRRTVSWVRELSFGRINIGRCSDVIRDAIFKRSAR
jgi:hypothetical protein